MQSTAYFDEFRSPSFAAGGASVRAFEAMLLGLFALALARRTRFALPDLAMLVVTTHWALAAQRNMNLFVLVAAPLLARALTPLLESTWPSATRRWQAIGVEQARLRSGPIYVVAASVVFLTLAMRGRLPFPSTLDDQQLTAGATRFIEAHPGMFSRPFHTDALGGTLIYDFWPTIRVFVDDRNVVYGDDFMMHDYFAVLYGQPGWQKVLDRWDITSAIVLTSGPCAALFEASPAWTERYRDTETLIVERADRPVRPQSDG
jgi:hypothetical protein